MNRGKQGKDDKNSEAASEAVKGAADEMNRSLDELVRFFDMIFALRNIVILYAVLAIIAIIAFFWILYKLGYFSELGLDSPRQVLFLSTVVLAVFYGAVFTASCVYRFQLRKLYEKEYDQYEQSAGGIPNIWATWFLPLASILLVLGVQVSSIQDLSIDAPGQLRYILAFNAARLVILLMIGMELSYFVQKHHGIHRWSVLVTVSLLLDFVSYIIMIVGLEEPMFPGNSNQSGENLSETKVESSKALYVMVLGVASLCSSYYTIVKARQTDEVLGFMQRNLSIPHSQEDKGSEKRKQEVG